MQREDIIMLKAMGELAVETGDPICLRTARLLELGEAAGLSREHGFEALEALESFSYAERSRTVSPTPPDFRLQSLGLEQYFRHFFPEYDLVQQKIALAIVNHDLRTNRDLAEHLSLPRLLVNHVLRSMKYKNAVQLAEAMGDHVQVVEIGVRLKRFARGDASL